MRSASGVFGASSGPTPNASVNRVVSPALTIAVTSPRKLSDDPSSSRTAPRSPWLLMRDMAAWFDRPVRPACSAASSAAPPPI